LRLPKLLLILCSVVVITIVIGYLARNPLASYFVNHSLSKLSSSKNYNYVDGKLTCLKFNFSANLDINISKLCLTSPQAQIKLTNTTVKWRLSTPFSLDMLSVKSLNIETLHIKSTQNIIQLFGQQTNAKTNVSFDNLTHYMQQVAQLTSPIDINVKSVNYQPFLINKTKSATVYWGDLFINKNTLNFSLKEQSKTQQLEVVSARITTTGKSFSAKLTTELPRLRRLLAAHQITLPAKLAKNLNIKGRLSNQFHWQNDALIINSQLDKLSITSARTINHTNASRATPFELESTLTWQTHVKGSLIDIDFKHQDQITLTYHKNTLLDLLLVKEIPTQIITLLKDNSNKGVVIIPQGRVKINLAKESANIERLTIINQDEIPNNDLPTTLKLRDIIYSFTIPKKMNSIQAQANFSIDGKIKSSVLKDMSKQPINITANGSIKQYNSSWQMQLLPSSHIELNKIELKHNEQEANIASIAKLKTAIHGDISINKYHNISLALQVDSEAHQIDLAKKLQLNSMQLNASINGNLDNITLDAEVNAEHVSLAQLKVSSESKQLQFDVYANNILLTELLTLKAKLPVPIALIDGSLSYQLKGKTNDFENLANLPNNLNSLLNDNTELFISLKNVTGEIDGTWLQELNWQQKFNLTNNKLNSITEKSPNLTIKLIETASPISNFSAQTHSKLADIKQINKALKLSAVGIQGDIFDGSFSIDEVAWPLLPSHSVNVQLNNIDLEKVLELDKKQGIVVTGRISGQLPVYSDGKHFLIKKGELHNISKGLIQVMDNPAVEELKASNEQLKLAFDALQNLHYDQLSSDISMENDGYMLLKTVIKGRNPDLDNEVNLNLNLSYDLLGLLESMTITDHFEKNIIKGIQKP